MLSVTKVKNFREDGFVNGGELLASEEVETLRNELERVMKERDREDVPQPVLLRNLNGRDPAHPVWQIVNIWEASEPFKKLTRHPQLLESVARLSGAAQLRVWHDQVQYKPAAQGGVNMWHQDAPKWPILTPNTAQLSAWIAFDDVDASNGCMSMVPGSHAWGDQDKALNGMKSYAALPEADRDGHAVESRLCPVRKGHVHFHHGLTWHGSHANESDRPRRAIAIHFMTGETKYNASGEHVMKRFVEVADGERMEGLHFPLVWEE